MFIYIYHAKLFLKISIDDENNTNNPRFVTK